ncbi:flagellin [Dethiosulfovibrio salsuginis]|uniref:Flagellin C-terminal helical region n=1 Tax=Dethiosulfovibrio salsuginis TaxID=561720 RepID=A0A1X7IZ20_9BACT|nr:flagellin [Dethiosulfovibrio salsuginis]SMG20403.1 flagellin C-terminal helical region [Dethiosulfovibrio salsuginis]
MSLPVKPIDEVLTNGVTASFTSGKVAFAAIKGSTDVFLHLYDISQPDSIQIFTRDGVLLAGIDPPEEMVDFTEANGFLPGATYQPTGPLVNPAYNNVSPYSQVVYKGTEMAYSGSDNPGGGNLNEYFFIKESPEDLLVFVTGNGSFDITATWTEIKKQDEYSSDYSLSAPLILRSAVPGNDGRINLSGDDDLLNALGFSVVQQSREPIREVLVKDAHSGDVTSSGTVFSGNMVVGVVNPGIDMSIDPSNAVNVRWSDESKGFILSGGDMSFVVHLSDNKTVLQTGANEGEKVGLLFSDSTARGLGLLPPSPSVLSKDLAGGTLSRIDRAINTVSTERTRLGAYQNRLEHTISNVTVASQNLLESKSRIKDLDMAKEMMNFTKINILLQSGTSILAQANQSPDGVLQLLKGQ